MSSTRTGVLLGVTLATLSMLLGAVIFRQASNTAESYYHGRVLEQQMSGEFATEQQIQIGERDGFYRLVGEQYRTRRVETVLDQALQGAFDDLPVVDLADDRLRVALVTAAPMMVRSEFQYALIVSYLRDWREQYRSTRRLLNHQIDTYVGWLTPGWRVAGFPTRTLRVSTGCLVTSGSAALEVMRTANLTGHRTVR